MSSSTQATKGCVLVMSNSFVNCSSLQRVDAHAQDVKDMQELWGEMLKCDSFGNSVFKVYEDVDARGMIKLLTDFASYKTRIDYSYIAVVISTHGGLIAESWVKKWHPTTVADFKHVDWKVIYNDYQEYCEKKSEGHYKDEKMVEIFFGNDFRPVKERKIKELFYNFASPGWHNVPKFFILDYCRGDTTDVIRVPPPATPKLTSPTGSPPAEPQGTGEMANLLLPRVSDVLTIYATHLSYAAIQGRPGFGSWLISSIAEVFKKNAGRMHVVDMLAIVNDEMKKKQAKYEGGLVKAMSIYESSLVQNLYLCDDARSRGECLDFLSRSELKREEIRMLEELIRRPKKITEILANSSQREGSTSEKI